MFIFTRSYFNAPILGKYLFYVLNFSFLAFLDFFMWFSFSTFPGTKFVINGHFTLILVMEN